MHHIICLGKASQPFSPLELVKLLIETRMYNEQHSITGALVYGNGQFIQVIEGGKEAVRSLYQQIARDPRYQQVVQLSDKAITRRLFAHWLMAFKELSADQLAELLSYVSPQQLARRILTMSEIDKPLLDRMKEIVSA